MTNDELENKPVSDAEFAEFMRPASDTREIPIACVKFRVTQFADTDPSIYEPRYADLTQQELDDLLDDVSELSCVSMELPLED